MKKINYLIISVIVLILPFFFRYLQGNPLLWGDAYVGLEELPFMINLLSSEILAVALPILFGVVSVLFLWLILKELDFKFSDIFMFIFIVNPMFISIFLGKYSLMMLSIFIGTYLFLKKKYIFTLFSTIFFLPAIVYGLEHFIIIMIGLYFIAGYKKIKKKYYIILSLCILVILIYLYKWHSIPDLIYSLSIKEFFSDLGGKGFSIFSILLAILGIGLLSDYKKENYFGFIFIPALIIFSFFFNFAMIYANFAVVFLASKTVDHLLHRKWYTEIKYLSLVLVLCGILFSTISYASRIGDALPNHDIIESLEWLRASSIEGGVLTHSSNKYLIEGISQRNITDNENIFYSNDIKYVKQYMEENYVKFVVITKNMYEGLVWDDNKTGLAYLLNNRQTFKKIFSNSYVGIWSLK